MNWRQVMPSVITLAAMLSGFLSILVTFEGMRKVSPDPYYQWAALLIMLAMILDGMDGNLARFLKGTSAFGAELDTYVDLTAFGIAPAILVFAVTFKGEANTGLWRILLPSAVAVSGVVRLARFKVRDPLRGQAGYAGLPITANAGWVALFVFISQSVGFSLNHGRVASLFLVGVVVFIVLQVTNLRYPKPTKNAALFAPCVVLVGALLFLSYTDFEGSREIAVGVASIMVALGVGYIAFGPLFVKSVAAHKAKMEARMNGGRTDEEYRDFT